MYEQIVVVALSVAAAYLALGFASALGFVSVGVERFDGDRVCVDPRPNLPGTWVEPACIARRKAKLEAG